MAAMLKCEDFKFQKNSSVINKRRLGTAIEGTPAVKLRGPASLL